MKICKNEQEFIDYVAPIAQKVCKRYGFLPSILVAQTFHENGAAVPTNFDNNGIYKLMEYNNMVGQKAELLNDTWADYSVWPGMQPGKYDEYSFEKITPEEYNGKMKNIPDRFRKFDSVEQSLADYILFLLYAKDSVNAKSYRYGPDVVNIKDPEKLITAVGKKYATGSSYAKNVMSIVRRYNLTKYDDLSNVKPTDIVPDSLKTKYGITITATKTETSKKTNIKKLAKPRFVDNRDASQSQVPKWRNRSDVKYIVVHYLGVVGQNFELWNNGYGATFTIAWNGDVYWTADYTAITWQCGGSIQGESKDGDGVAPHRFYKKCTNDNSVSIENCIKRTDGKYEGDDNDDKWYFTEETQESLVWAVSKMMDDLNIPIDRVIRHFDVTGKTCPNPYVRENGKNGNWTWTQFKDNLKQYRKDGTITIPSGTTTANASTTPTTIATSKSYLAKGDSGDDVKTLQTMLNACGYNCGAVDGDFGSKTDKAVREFQSATGLVVDGMYGVKTKGILEQMYKNAQVLYKETENTISGTKYNGVDYSPVYNYSYYKKKYADLQKAFGNDKDAYFRHFCQYGMKEGRKATSSFDVQKYKSKYADLRKAFGENLPEYYKHYCIYGKKEGRKAT